MKSYVIAFVTLAVSLLLGSCANKTQEEINSDCSSGVVLIRAMSYYELRLSNGEVYFFSDYDKENGLANLTDKRSEIVKSESYGTGFFVNKQGLIATNKHVVSGKATNEDIQNALRDIIDNAIDNIRQNYEELQAQYREAQQAVSYAEEMGEYDAEANENMRLLSSQLNKLYDSYQSIKNINPARSELYYHTDLGISYNNSLVMKTSEIVPCHIVRKSKEHDLALIQLNSGVTPSDKHIFTIPKENPLTHYSLADKWRKQMGNDKNAFIYMIGFNLGPTLALTKEGIKAQINMGNISQHSEKTLMYSIPALPGSSGSPVVNAQEELVAINFAGINITQNFNYGIPVKFLQELLNNVELNDTP